MRERESIERALLRCCELDIGPSIVASLPLNQSRGVRFPRRMADVRAFRELQRLLQVCDRLKGSPDPSKAGHVVSGDRILTARTQTPDPKRPIGQSA